MTPSKHSLWLHRSAVALAGATLFLIFVGGLVTSTDSGLAVPDWPLSYGRLMPPMVGGIFYEHGHRMVAALVGLLTVLFAFFALAKETRPWVKKAAWIAVSLVIFQGLLGGATVLLRLPSVISILHACTAQTFLCLVIALAVWTSSFWKRDQKPLTNPPDNNPINHISLVLFVLAFFQLIMGAVLRHTGWALIPHITGAFLVAAFSFWAFIRVAKNYKTIRPLFYFSLATLAAVLIQITLGFITYLILGHEFSVVPAPFYAALLITAHVAMGALVLGLSAVLALLSHRLRDPHGAPLKRKLTDYFELTKPGITFTAGITALAGFVLGSKGDISFLKLIHTGVGTLLIAGGAGTLNMLIEKDVDASMKRTRKRPLPAGRLKPGEVLLLGSILSVAAILYLSWTVNLLTALIAGITLSIYLYLYTPLKKITAMCTAVGAVAGALPPVMGWAAATGTLGLEALVLFSIIFFWQFPHFFSLAWLYKEDYQQAGLHMLPPIQDNGATIAISICVNSVLLLGVSLLPTFMEMTGWIYLGAALTLGGWMIISSFLFLFDRSIPKARQLFFTSLAYIPFLVVAMVLNKAPLS